MEDPLLEPNSSLSKETTMSSSCPVNQQDTKHSNIPPSSNDSKEEVKHDLSVENNFLKEYIARLHQELSFTQESLETNSQNNKSTTNSTTSTKQHGIPLPNWMLSSSIMSPLFTAYDTRIHKLLELLEQQGNQLSAVTDTTQELIHENEHLRNQIIMLPQKMMNHCNHSNQYNDPLNLPEHSCELQHQNMGQKQLHQEQYQHSKQIPSSNRDVDDGAYHPNSSNTYQHPPLLLDAEHKLLMDQAEILSSELKHAHQEIANKDTALAQLTQSMNTSSQTLLQLEQQLHIVQNEKTACEQALINNNSELGDWKRKVDTLKRTTEKYTFTVFSLNGTIDELKNQNKELEEETESLSSKICISSQRIQNVETQLSKIAHENDTLADQKTALSITLETIQSEKKQMEQVLQHMEHQIQTLQDREAKRQTSFQECQTKMEDAILTSHQKGAQIKILKQEVETLLKQINTHVKTQSEHEHNIWQNVHKRLSKQIQTKTKEYEELMEQMAHLKYNHDVCQRDKKDFETKFNALKSIQEGEQDNLEQKVKEWKEQLVLVEDARNQEEHQRKELEINTYELRQNLETCEKKLLHSIEIMEHERLKYVQTIKEYSQKCTSLEKEFFKMKQETQNLSEHMDLNEFQRKADMDAKIVEYSLEIDALKVRAQQAEAMALEHEHNMKITIENSEKELNDLRAEKKEMIKRLEVVLTDERTRSKHHQDKNKELAGNIEKMNVEHKTCSVSLSQAKEQIMSLKHNLQVSEQGLQELGKQFSDKIEELKMCGIEERKLKSDLREAKMELELLQNK